MNTQKKPLSFLLMLFLPLLLIACSSNETIKVSSDFNTGYDYDALQTYGWYQAEPRPEDNAVNPLVKQRVIDSIKAVLASKKYSENSESPDFLVHFTVASSSTYDVKSYYTYSGYEPTFSWNREGFGVKPLEQRDSLGVIREGSLVIDIIEPRKKTLMWRGIAKKNLKDRPYSAAETDEIVKNAVQQVLASFPPKPKK